MSEKILGLYVGPHGASAALLVDGEPVRAIQLERLLGIKHAWVVGKHNREFARKRVWHDFQPDLLPWEAAFPRLIDEVCRPFSLDDIDLVALEKKNLINCPAETGIIDKDNELAALFAGKQILEVEHHQGHQAQAFFASPFEEAVVATIDGRSWGEVERLGDTISLTLAHGKGSRIETFFESNYSLTSLYDRLSILLFGKRYCEGKTMGLASYGALECNNDRFQKHWLMHLEADPPVPDGLRYLDRSGLAKDGLPGYVQDVLRLEGLGPVARDSEPNRVQRQAAYLCQRYFEEDLFRVLRFAHKASVSGRVCLAGGGGLNSVANGKITARTDFEQVFVFPNCGDEGLSLGFALWAHHMEQNRPRSWYLTSDALGPIYSREQIDRALISFGDAIQVTDWGGDIHQKTAALLADGLIVACFQGRSEFGPRALGHRSILAHPGLPRMKERLNRRVKFRESWRPFAPSVLAEHTNDWFEIDQPSPFMLLVAPVREEKRPLVPAICHVDGSARLQTVDERYEPYYHATIAAFYRLTGLPLVLDTSFNVQGQPIVETPYQAIESFLATNIDTLVMETMLIDRASKKRR